MKYLYNGNDFVSRTDKDIRNVDGSYLLEDIQAIRPTQRFHILAGKIVLIYTNIVSSRLNFPPIALFIRFYQAQVAA
jgi:hypothetical protein